jgi:phage shock protein E
MKNIKEIIAEGKAVLVDVREPWEYNEQHIERALNIPLNEITRKIADLKKMNGPFVLYCRSGNRSGMAMNLLKQAGISNAYNGGGIFDMQKIMN